VKKKTAFDKLMTKVEKIIEDVECYNSTWKTEPDGFAVKATRKGKSTSVSGMLWDIQKNRQRAALRIYKLISEYEGGAK
jgi:hypothetical protein